jgi:hypothetical protein
MTEKSPLYFSCSRSNQDFRKIYFFSPDFSDFLEKSRNFPSAAFLIYPSPFSEGIRNILYIEIEG